MRVLYCVSELSPLFKLGGLGDVAGSLPKALASRDVDIRVALPFFSSIDRAKYQISTTPIEVFSFPFAEKEEQERVEIFETKIPQSPVPVYLFANPKYLSVYVSSREYGASVNISERFVFFSEALVVWLVKRSRDSRLWYPEITHLNDWHVSLIPSLLTTKKKEGSLPDVPKTLLTIHNLSYQGIYRKGSFKKNQNILKLGITTATKINTVSPTYAREILTPKYGQRLDRALRLREQDITGILNGLDYDIWDPEKDPFLNVKCQMSNVKTFKERNKFDLQRSIGLPPLTDIPLLAFVGRIEPKQKGIDILIQALKKLPLSSVQIVILGTGEPIWEERLRVFVQGKEQAIVFIDRFDEALAHQIYAGSDFVLVPSRFEPCGLVQMIAMRYLTVPIVRATGGLADTVEDGETGICFREYSAADLLKALKRAIDLYRDDSSFSRLRANAQKRDFSWHKSAEEYVELYKGMVKSID